MTILGKGTRVAPDDVHERLRRPMPVDGLPCSTSSAATKRSSATRRRVKRQMIDEGVLGLGSGTRCIRFRPPLDLTPEVADEGLRRVAGRCAPEAVPGASFLGEES